MNDARSPAVLAISARYVQRLIGRIEATGVASIRHKAIGRPSNSKIATGVRDYAAPTRLPIASSSGIGNAT